MALYQVKSRTWNNPNEQLKQTEKKKNAYIQTSRLEKYGGASAKP
jgi:hypothetical protein